jgi:PAS domain S-box-containing protein
MNRMTQDGLPPRGAWLATLVTGGIALLALAGWAFDIATLKSMAPHWQTMSVITAICLVLVALQLACLQKYPSAAQRRLVLRAPAILVGLVGLVTTILYSIDLITGSAPPVESVPLLRLFWIPGIRIALLTAILLMCVACALWLLAIGSRRAANVAHAFTAPAAMAGYLVVVSYLLRVSAMHELLGVRVALNAGLAFCAVSVAIFALRPDTWLTSVFTSDQAGSLMARRLLPVLLLVPLAIGWVRLHGERTGAFHSEVGVVLVALTYAVVLVGMVWLTAKSVNRADARLRTAELQAHKVLRDSEQQLATVFQASPTGIFITRLADGSYVGVNEAYLTIIGYAADEVVGHTSLELNLWVNPEDCSALGQMQRDLGQPETREIQLRHKSGRIVDVLVSALPLDRGGEACTLGTLTDITERKRAEEKVRHQNAVLEGINRIFREALTCETEEEVGRICLTVAGDLTGSAFGFVGEINSQTGRLDAVAISDPGWEACRMADSTGHQPELMGFQIHGLYGRVLLDGDRKSVV